MLGWKELTCKGWLVLCILLVSPCSYLCVSPSIFICRAFYDSFQLSSVYLPLCQTLYVSFLYPSPSRLYLSLVTLFVCFKHSIFFCIPHFIHLGYLCYWSQFYLFSACVCHHSSQIHLSTQIHDSLYLRTTLAPFPLAHSPLYIFFPLPLKLKEEEER